MTQPIARHPQLIPLNLSRPNLTVVCRVLGRNGERRGHVAIAIAHQAEDPGFHSQVGPTCLKVFFFFRISIPLNPTGERI